MSTTISPNMNLIIPTVGSEPGPDYGTDINSSLTLVDLHDHSPGKGVPISPAGMDINDNLDFNGNFAIDVGGVTLEAQSVTPDVLSVYASGVDLYYVDGLGNNIRMTQSGGVAGTPGSIANLVPPASATYVAGSKTFVWQSSASIAANMDAAAIIMRNITPNSTYGLTLQPPATLSQNYSITLPTLPVAASFMQMSSLGVISSSVAVSHGLTADNIAAGTQIPVVIANLTSADNPYSLAAGTGMVVCDTGAGNIAVNLYTAVGNEGKRVIIKKTAAAHTVSIFPFGSQAIDDGLTEYLLLGINDSITLISNGSDWLVVERDLAQYLNATAASAAIPGTGVAWFQASGNSIALPQGDWELTGECIYTSTGNIFNGPRAAWYGANGDNTNATPASISNITILSGYQGVAGTGTAPARLLNSSVQVNYVAPANLLRVRVGDGGTTVYLNAGNASSASGGAVNYEINLAARRLR